MVEAWGNVLTIIGNTLSVWTEIILFDSFFPRKKSGKTYWLFVAVGILAISSFSFFIGSSDGYTLKILFEVAFYYILCAILYQSRWDRRLFIAVTTYAVFYTSAYWLDTLCMYMLNLSYKEYMWNIYQGVGPDLLVIDNLGYLYSSLLITNSPTLFQDITNICNQEYLYSNITHLYTNKEKTYAIPLRIMVPTVGGRDLEAVNSANTLDVLSANVFKNEPLNGIELYQKILAGLSVPKPEIVFNYAEALPELYYPIWRNYIKLDDALSKDRYQNLIEILQSIVKYNNLTFQENSNEVPSNNSPTNFMNSDSVVFCDLITRSDNFIIPFYDFINNSHRDGYINFISAPDDIKYCIPSSVITLPSGANDSSEDFLLFLLSNDIQSELLGDGLPVNYLAFNQSITDASATYNVSLCNNISSDMSTLVPIADIDSLRDETNTFSEIFQSYCSGQISLETAYELYEKAS